MKRPPQAGDVISIHTGMDSLGRIYWFEAPEGFVGDRPPPGTIVHGPFASAAEAEASQNRELFGPDCQVIRKKKPQ
jgi:hypothetical protein